MYVVPAGLERRTDECIRRYVSIVRGQAGRKAVPQGLKPGCFEEILTRPLKGRSSTALHALGRGCYKSAALPPNPFQSSMFTYGVDSVVEERPFEGRVASAGKEPAFRPRVPFWNSPQAIVTSVTDSNLPFSRRLRNGFRADLLHHHRYRAATTDLPARDDRAASDRHSRALSRSAEISSARVRDYAGPSSCASDARCEHFAGAGHAVHQGRILVSVEIRFDLAGQFHESSRSGLGGF